MGAWGHGPWENDAALDWLDWASDDGPGAIEAALNAAVDADYLDVDEGSAAVAAAAIVAAARDGNIQDLPDAVADFVRDWKPESTVIRRAIDALGAVAGSRSELASLWDAGSEGPTWRATLERLGERLNAT